MAATAETHADLAIQAMRAGKDVFVEKPMALSMVVMLKKCRKLPMKRGSILMVGHLLEYHPAVLKLGTDKLGGMGKINYIYSNRLNFGKFAPWKMPYGALLLMM